VEESCRIIESALDHGVNFIDTARTYKDSEERIGLVMERRREECILSSKTMNRGAEGAWRDVKKSLEKMRTKKIDVYFIHEPKFDSVFEQVMRPGGALQGLKIAKATGKIDFIGISSHRPDLIRRALETDEFDCIQIPYNPIDSEMFEDVIPLAKERDVGVVVMKPLAGGVLKDAETALKFILRKDVSTVIPGMSCIEHVVLDTKVGKEIEELSPESERLLLQEAERLGEKFCRRCGYCEVKCPAKIPISYILQLERYATAYFAHDFAYSEYKKLKPNASNCEHCGRCEAACPYELPVQHMLERAHNALRKSVVKTVLIKAKDSGKRYLVKLVRNWS
jgi:hypothetical protein